MHGAVTDNNATLFANGYDAVLAPYFASHKWTLVGKLQPNEVPAGTWTPSVALTEFEQEYTAHSTINAVLMPNDENGAPIITYLKSKGIKADTFPVTGQDATLTGLGNVLTGYQCGTVYKPIYLEAQAAVALAVYLRAGMTPPAALVNGTTADTTEHKARPLRAADARMGHQQEHGLDRHRRQVRASGTAVRSAVLLGRRLQGSWYQPVVP